MQQARLNKQVLLDRIDEFRRLEKGWDTYGASPISEKAIEAAKGFLTHFNVAPTANGGINLDVVFGRTERGGFEFSVGFNEDGKVVEFWSSFDDGYALKGDPAPAETVTLINGIRNEERD